MAKNIITLTLDSGVHRGGHRVNRRTVLQSSFVLGACAARHAAGRLQRTRPADTRHAGATGASGSRVLLAYFSRAGENYFYGGRTTLDIGNTEIVAGIIASAVEVDVFRIEAADPYPQSYDATVDRNVREQDAEARPAITGTLPVVASYDTVLLGSGIWNVRPPMIMRTFVESVDLTGKTIFPFVTYAVSGLGDTIDDYTRLCPRSTIGEGLAVRGEQVADSRGDVEAWVRRIGLLSS